MKLLTSLAVITVLLTASGSFPATAGGTDPLFVNLTTDEPHRANMALTFGKNQLERGHPLTIFLNDKGVFLGSKVNTAQYADHQAALNGLMQKGASVIICPMCMKHYGVKEEDVLPGIKVGNPELTGSLLFKDDTRTLTW